MQVESCAVPSGTSGGPITLVDPVWHPSPNFGVRKGGAVPSLVVIHYTAMEGPQPALDRLCDPAFEVSAHYLIGQGGQLWHMVQETDRAWHAGAGSWRGCTDVNSSSIGIEICNRGDHPFPVAQIETLENLVAGILQRWNIPASGVIGHSDMAPGRKVDPGALFPWGALAARGLAIHPDAGMDRPIPVCPDHFRRCVKAFGYSADSDDATLLSAVRLRFAPEKSGPLDAGDMALAAGLANLVDQTPSTA